MPSFVGQAVQQSAPRKPGSHSHVNVAVSHVPCDVPQQMAAVVLPAGVPETHVWSQTAPV